ncbi:hypothetical protein Lser_V15G45572 [Lactuca serriola]
MSSSKSRKSLDPSMEDLPAHVMVDILSRLPVKTIIHCKCVCKKWLDLISESYFADHHLSRSPSGIMIYHNSNEVFRNAEEEQKTGYLRTGILRWVEVEDKLDHHYLHHDPIMSLDLNLAPIFQKSQILPVGSVNGLLCLWQFGPQHDKTYICNPITREYMILPKPQYYLQHNAHLVYCFGVAPLTNEYKVIRIFQGEKIPYFSSNSRPIISQAEVYTLGTGQWRSLGHVPYWLKGMYGPFLNGHAHWTVLDKDSSEKLCVFDFEKETFELFPSPPCEARDENLIFKSLGVLKGCLCRCESYDSQLVVWVMKEYGIKKSWRKEFVVMESENTDLDLLTLETVDLITGFKDGTVLMASYRDTLLVYCPRREIILDTEMFYRYFKGYTFRPSFRRLHNFENERVYMF